jgi:hypothetical protein
MSASVHTSLFATFMGSVYVHSGLPYTVRANSVFLELVIVINNQINKLLISILNDESVGANMFSLECFQNKGRHRTQGVVVE